MARKPRVSSRGERDREDERLRHNNVGGIIKGEREI